MKIYRKLTLGIILLSVGGVLGWIWERHEQQKREFFVLDKPLTGEEHLSCAAAAAWRNLAFQLLTDPEICSLDKAVVSFKEGKIEKKLLILSLKKALFLDLLLRKEYEEYKIPQTVAILSLLQKKYNINPDEAIDFVEDPEMLYRLLKDEWEIYGKMLEFVCERPLFVPEIYEKTKAELMDLLRRIVLPPESMRIDFD